MAENASPILLSSKYYLDTVTLEVEDTVYKVLSKPFIEKSVVFRDILSATQPKTYKGLVDNKPILFEDVKGVDWEFLLSVLLEPVSPLYGGLQQWLSILELSRKCIDEIVE